MAHGSPHEEGCYLFGTWEKQPPPASGLSRPHPDHLLGRGSIPQPNVTSNGTMMCHWVGHSALGNEGRAGGKEAEAQPGATNCGVREEVGSEHQGSAAS